MGGRVVGWAVLGAFGGLAVAVLIGMAIRISTADLEAAARETVPDPAAATFARVESVPLPATGEGGSVNVTLPGGRQADVLAAVQASAGRAGWTEHDRDVSPGGTAVVYRRGRLQAHLRVPDDARQDTRPQLFVQVAQPRPLLDVRAAVLVLVGAALGAGTARVLGGRGAA